VVAGIGGSEGETAFGGAALGDDAVVGVEGFVDGDGDGDGGGGDVGLSCGVILVGFVVAWRWGGRLERRRDREGGELVAAYRRRGCL